MLMQGWWSLMELVRRSLAILTRQAVGLLPEPDPVMGLVAALLKR